ncbi:Sugar kinase of the NBD/HSP70 family, may contain an N-terminal HTH domain [Devosia lucknowensis]|uniref:Sugar kinase of the NBD/HSP70 family, may contain an N-terminal HTH domain n=1 Tax=Devosia lucknowensis TaxID=1096929 RepID=A0A1Y6ETG9_9HYPH|nr:ROK family protein [Devosia lucknowensis]SMQ66014.1 Sugar kinase of the NBD/HSP70 family, may contain an N-terminal HTH domain [Devosia lucknowensis]
MTRNVSDSDSVRRQNRGLLLAALRSGGPQSRTALAGVTGLSHASVTAIMQDLISQEIVEELTASDRPDARMRGRPATLVGFRRSAAYVALFELDVNRLRASLVDYSGILVDRIETAITPQTFRESPPTAFFSNHLKQLRARTPQAGAALRRMAISVQGILDRESSIVKWSPIPMLAESTFSADLAADTGLPVTLHKRGRLLAEGTRWLDPKLHDASVATVFIGSTVAMGLSLHGQIAGRGEGGATEFGHMNHIPSGALCRCGMRGCIEAYAADYGVLRTAYSVPETASPALAVPAQQFDSLIQRAGQGDRAAKHGFNLAGRAIGYGLSRMLSMFDPSHILIVGPGARALPLMQGEIEAALGASLVCRINGMPTILAHLDEKEPIFRGLLMKTLGDVDRVDFAALPSVPRAEAG